MPQAVASWAASAFSGAAVGSFAGATAAGTVTAVSVGLGTALVYAGAYIVTAAAIGIGLSQLAGAVVGKRSLGAGALNSGSPLQMTREAAAYRRVVYGETRLSGPILDAFISGAGNDHLHLVVALAAHECESIGDVYFNDEVETLDGNGIATGSHAGYARVKKHLGAAGQTADPDYLTDAGVTRASTDKFSGIAYLYGRFTWSPNIWPGSLPNLSAVVKGRKCYDPRTETTVWTDNPAICIRDYLVNTDFGLSVDAADIDDTSFVAAANICDEEVALAAGGTEPRYRCNGSFEVSAEPATILQKLVESMAGALVYVGGKWILYAGAHATPETSHLTEDDLSGQISVQTKLSLRETCNRVRGTFASPDEKWQQADFTPIVNSTYLSEDGGIEIWRDMAFGFVTSHSQAQRLAKIELERTRQDIIVTAPCKLTALRYKPGDVIPVDNAEMGWEGKLFRCTGLKFSTTDVQGDLALGVDLTLRETAAASWDWNSGMETTYDPAANTNLVAPRTVATPAKPTLSTSNFVQPDGSITPRIQVQWVLPADTFVTNGGRIHIEYKKTADSTWLAWDSAMAGSVEEDFITGVHAGVSYDVRVAFENVYGVRGAWSEHEFITIGNDSTVPDAPTGLTATAGPGCVVLDWDDNAEADLDHYELWRSASSDFSSPSLVWTGYASQHADFTATVGTTYYYKLKASDTSDNLSGYSSQVSAAANDTTGPAGAAGGYTDYIFKRAATAPATPTGDTPAGWSDAPPAADGNPLWMSVGDKTNAGVLVGAWSTPVNTDTGLIFEYSVDGSTSWHTTFTAGDLYARHKVLGGSFTAAYRIVGEQGATGATGPQGPEGPQGPAGPTGPEGPALTYSLTIDWHASGLGGGTINGTPYSGTSTTVTGLNPGSWVDISADANVSGDNWTSWGGSSVGQLEQSTGTNSNRILMGGNLSLIANY